jgi:peptidoglycan/LPS O-acetylase OafA/YrhL
VSKRGAIAGVACLRPKKIAMNRLPSDYADMVDDSRRLVGIDVLRAIAVIGVLAGHLRAIPGLFQLPQGGLEGAAWRLTEVGAYGVVLFFAISGFVITRTTARRDGDLAHMRVGAFYVRRIARIWPAFLLSVAFGIVALLAASRSSPAAIIFIFGNAPFTPAFWLSIATFTFNFANALAALSGQQ